MQTDHQVPIPRLSSGQASANAEESGRGRVLQRWLRSPVLHFVLIGVALFGMSTLRAPSVHNQSRATHEPIVISAERIRLMQADFVQRWGMKPTPAQLRALIEQTIEEELLYREARVLALDFGDSSVRRRLVEKMRAVSDRPSRSHEELYQEARALGLDDDVVIRRLLVAKMRVFLQQDPNEPLLGEKDLLEYLQRNRDRFLQPARATFAHVYLSATTHGEDVEKDARSALARLRGQSPSSDAAIELSDPFPLGLEFRAQLQTWIASRFGKSFAEQLFALQPGRWSDPIASPYGLHLLWVHEKLPEGMPPVDAVRKQVAYAVSAERAAARLQRGVAQLRTLYEIRVEGGDEVSAPDTSLAARP